MQTQTLLSKASGSGSITQNQNKSSASGPNVSLNIAQNQSPTFLGFASGANTANFTQENTLTAVASTTGPGPVKQWQSSTVGGIQAIVNQYSQTPSAIDAIQNETQCEDALTFGALNCGADTLTYPLEQKQYGPVRKDAGSTQSGNSGSTFTIIQTSTQNNDTGQNQTNEVQGACATSGYCTVNQTTTVNGDTTPNTQAGQNVDTTTSCTGSTCTAPPAGITFDGSPGTAGPPSTLGPYTMTAFGPDSQPSCPATVTGVTDPAGTIGFSEALQHDQATGPCWATWSHGYTGDVYDTISAVDPNQVTITLPSGTNAFYFYAEPNVYNLFNVQATAQNGTTSGSIQVQGNSGAKYFGFYGTGGTTLATITVTTDPAAGGFAVGEFGIQVAPIFIS